MNNRHHELELLNVLMARDEHETKIADLLNNNVYFASRGEPPLGRLVIMLFTNRSGSNLLAEYLTSSGEIIGFEESLNWDEVKRAVDIHAISSFTDYMTRLYLHKAATGNLVAIKASLDQFLMLYRWGYFIMFNPLTVIHVTRDDVVSQAVSFSIASQSGQWTSEMEGKFEPTYNFNEIAYFANRIVLQNSLATLVLSAANIHSLPVKYENIIAEPLAATNSVLSYLGLSTLKEIKAQTRLQKQATHLNDVFRARFEEELLSVIGLSCVD